MQFGSDGDVELAPARLERGQAFTLVLLGDIAEVEAFCRQLVGTSCAPS